MSPSQEWRLTEFKSWGKSYVNLGLRRISGGKNGVDLATPLWNWQEKHVSDGWGHRTDNSLLNAVDVPTHPTTWKKCQDTAFLLQHAANIPKSFPAIQSTMENQFSPYSLLGYLLSSSYFPYKCEKSDLPVLDLKSHVWPWPIQSCYQSQIGVWITCLGLGYKVAGMKRATELWLLGLGKWEETVVNLILKTASHFFPSMRAMTEINPKSLEIVIEK